MLLLRQLAGAGELFGCLQFAYGLASAAPLPSPACLPSHGLPRALQVTGLEDQLYAPGVAPYTLFAPTDAAWEEAAAQLQLAPGKDVLQQLNRCVWGRACVHFTRVCMWCADAFTGHSACMLQLWQSSHLASSSLPHLPPPHPPTRSPVRSTVLRSLLLAHLLPGNLPGAQLRSQIYTTAAGTAASPIFLSTAGLEAAPPPPAGGRGNEPDPGIALQTRDADAVVVVADVGAVGCTASVHAIDAVLLPDAATLATLVVAAKPGEAGSVPRPPPILLRALLSSLHSGSRGVRECLLNHSILLISALRTCY